MGDIATPPIITNRLCVRLKTSAAVRYVSLLFRAISPCFFTQGKSFCSSLPILSCGESLATETVEINQHPNPCRGCFTVRRRIAKSLRFFLSLLTEFFRHKLILSLKILSSHIFDNFLECCWHEVVIQF